MLPATPAPALPAQPSLTALPGASPSAEPEPTPTSTGAIREAVDGLAGGVTDQNCGTQDGTLCGLLNRALGDIEQARFVSDLVSVPLFVIAVLLDVLFLLLARLTTSKGLR